MQRLAHDKSPRHAAERLSLDPLHGCALRRLVADTLRPMEAERRCYHLVSGVLIERTVKEMLPAIEHNRDAVRRRGANGVRLCSRCGILNSRGHVFAVA